MAQKTIVVDELELDKVLEALGKAQAELVYRLRNLYAAREVENNPSASVRVRTGRTGGPQPAWVSPLLAGAGDVGGLEPGPDGCADPAEWPYFESTPIRSTRELELDLQNLTKARDVVKRLLSQS